MIVQRYYKYQENIPLIYSFYYEKYALKKMSVIIILYYTQNMYFVTVLLNFICLNKY